jgi:hypothetical protein
MLNTLLLLVAVGAVAVKQVPQEHLAAGLVVYLQQRLLL